MDSILKVLRRDPEAIPDAFQHPRLGPIGLDFEGASHIVDQRNKQYGDIEGGDPAKVTAKVLMEVAEAAIRGRIQEDLGPQKDQSNPNAGRIPSRIALVYQDHEVIVEPGWRTKYPNLSKGQTTWLVTGYRMHGSRKAAREAEKDDLAPKFEVRSAPTQGQKK